MKLSDKDRSRFWSKVKAGGPHECWEWQAAITWNGYGEWQQSVDGPDEETPEDRNSEMMGDILDGYNPADAAEALGVSVSTVYRIRRTGKASANTLEAMRQVWNGLGWE